MYCISLLSAVAFGSLSPLLVDCAVKGAVILLIAIFITVLLRHDSAATRHLVWLVAIVAVLVVPVCSAMLPQWRLLPAWAKISSEQPGVVSSVPVVESSVPSRGAATPSVSRTFTDVSQMTERLSIGDKSGAQSPVVVDQAVSRPFKPRANSSRLIPILWLFGFAMVILRLIGARLMLWSGERRATLIAFSPGARELSVASASQDALVTQFRNTCQKLDVRQSVRLLIHMDRTIPVVWGIFNPRLMLPTAARAWTVEQLQSVLLHELAHIKRRDAISQLLAQIACGLHWFNPLVWIAAWRLHVEREHACDDLVLASGVRRRCMPYIF